MQDRRFMLGAALGLAAVVLFGGSLPMTRLAVMGLDPWFVTSARGALAGLLAGAVLVVLRRPVPWRDLRTIALIALCLVVGFPLLTGLAVLTVASAHGGVVLGALPVATAVAAVFVAGERPSPLFWLLSLAGAALVVSFSLRHGSLLPVPGDLLIFAAVAVCGVGYAFSGTLSRRMPGWEVISWAVVLCLPLMIPVSLLTWPADAGAVPWPSWAALLYVALVSQYFGFWLWNTALALGGVARIGQIQLLQTFATLAIAAFLLSETIDRRTIGFALAVVVVVALGLRARVNTRRDPISAGGPPEPPS